MIKEKVKEMRIETIMYISGLVLIKEKEPKQLMKHVTNQEYISERITKIHINLYGRETVLIATYAPTDDSAINIKENYF